MKVASLFLVAALAVLAFASLASANHSSNTTDIVSSSPVTTDPWVDWTSSASHTIPFNWLMPVFAMLGYFAF